MHVQTYLGVLYWFYWFCFKLYFFTKLVNFFLLIAHFFGKNCAKGYRRFTQCVSRLESNFVFHHFWVPETIICLRNTNVCRIISDLFGLGCCLTGCVSFYPEISATKSKIWNCLETVRRQHRSWWFGHLKICWLADFAVFFSGWFFSSIYYLMFYFFWFSHYSFEFTVTLYTLSLGLIRNPLYAWKDRRCRPPASGPARARVTPHTHSPFSLAGGGRLMLGVGWGQTHPNPIKEGRPEKRLVRKKVGGVGTKGQPFKSQLERVWVWISKIHIFFWVEVLPVIFLCPLSHAREAARLRTR